MSYRTLPGGPVHAGRTHHWPIRSDAWRLSATQGPPDGEPVAGNDARGSIRPEGLVGGTYAFAVGVDLGREEETQEGENRGITAATLVELRRSG